MVPHQTTTTIDHLLIPATGEVNTWRERALLLAEAHGLLRTGRGILVRYDKMTGLPTSVKVRIASQSDADTRYDVLYDLATDTATCSCRAAKHGKPCAHAGAAIWYGRRMAAQYTPAALAEAERMAARDLAHEGNAAALGY